MALADLQEAIATLLVDARVRARLAEAPEALAMELHLDAAELETLRTIDAPALERVARSLAAKRRRALEAAVPLSARLWPELGPRYLELLAREPATSASLVTDLGPGLSELARTLTRLRAAVMSDPLAPPWAPDLLSLEFSRACSRRDGQTRILRCAHQAHRALEALAAGWRSIELEPHPCTYRVEATRLSWRDAEAR